MTAHRDPLTPETMARRIHDDVLQSLGAVMLHLEMCRRLLELNRSSELPEQFEEARHSLEEAVASLRRLLTDLRQGEGSQP